MDFQHHFIPSRFTWCFGCERRLGQNVTCDTWCGTTPVYIPINSDTNRQYLQGQNNTPSVLEKESFTRNGNLFINSNPWKQYLSKGSPPFINHEKTGHLERGPITPGIGDLWSPWLRSSCYASPKMGGFPYLLDNTQPRHTRIGWLPVTKIGLGEVRWEGWWSNGQTWW